MLKTCRGSCHCGAVQFEADLDLTQSTFRLLKGEAELTPYRFNTGKNHHYFCKHCGVRSFGVGNDTPIGKMFGVNVGCLDEVSDEVLASIPITYVDGRNDRWQSAPEFFHHL